MGTIIFWFMMSTVSVFIFRNRNEAAWNNISGCEKINGKMVQTMYPDHYTFHIILVAYWMAAVFAILAIYLAISLALDFSGLSSTLDIKTGLKELVRELQ